MQGFLRERLDSVLDQSYTDIEVIAVDDCSPDACGAILDEYAAREPRRPVLHLPQNVGRARNAGMPYATGDYLLFLNSDDTLTPGALRAMADRLDETADPDVLVFDYARTYWWGGTRRNVLAQVLTEGGDGCFMAAEHPEILDLLMVAWNKVHRRAFVEREGFTFPPGYYEDTPWTFPVLLSAERIATLDRICLNYRQRRQGNILSTTSRKHFDIHDQYERVFAFVDSRPRLSAGALSCTARWANTVWTSSPSRTGCPRPRQGRVLPAHGRALPQAQRRRPGAARTARPPGRLRGLPRPEQVRPTRHWNSGGAGSRCARWRPPGSRAAGPRRTNTGRWTPISRCTRRSRTAACSATRARSTTRRANSPRTSGCGWCDTRRRSCRPASSTSCRTRSATAGSPPAPRT